MQVDLDRCTGCGFCLRDCPVEAVTVIKKKASIDPERCTRCGVCLKVCPEEAVLPGKTIVAGSLVCEACPIRCQVPDGAMGACLRYRNENGSLVRLTPLHSFDDVKEYVGSRPDYRIQHPVITGLGAGTTYPCCKPAPHIVSENRDGIDVVTVVTEVPLSYSSIVVKVDTDVFIGKEGSNVLVGKRVVGMVETEQYGSKILHIGGVNRLTTANGFITARTVTDIANGNEVKLKIENGSRLTLKVGHPPVIDGREVRKMRIGCGSATLGIFAPMLRKVADEVIVLDSHVTGQLSRHVAGIFAGASPSGIDLVFKESTPGRYFGDHGSGWGGTSITEPAEVVRSVNMDVACAGMTVLITETTGQNGALFEIQPDGVLKPVPLTDDAALALKTIEDSCEPSMVSAMYTGGSGGSARAGVTRYPIRLTRAVHDNRACLSVCGAPGNVMPGGGITFSVDVGRVKPGSFYWTPTPATICPLEYTMTLEDYRNMGGHVEAMRPFSAKDPESGKNS